MYSLLLSSLPSQKLEKMAVSFYGGPKLVLVIIIIIIIITVVVLMSLLPAKCVCVCACMCMLPPLFLKTVKFTQRAVKALVSLCDCKATLSLNCF